MAKALGLIGNFKGKLGNTVGYSLKDSNNKQTQGVRVYQPVVRNPKTAAQAEQRMKLAPINATYRVLKMVIDRGQEGKAYGNKSRLAWLRDAIKAFEGAYFVKGATVNMPSIVPLTKGSLATDIHPDAGEEQIRFSVTGVTAAGVTTIGALSAAMIAQLNGLKEGDQVTFVALYKESVGMSAKIESIVLSSTSTENLPSFITIVDDEVHVFTEDVNCTAYSVIVSREGDNGAHLRNNTILYTAEGYDSDTQTSAAKQAAIESYMSQGANTDWAEESLM